MPLSVSSRQSLWGGVLALAATVAWSGNFIAAKSLAPHLSAADILFWRWGVATPVMFLLALPQLRTNWPAIRKYLPALAFYGFIGVCVSNFCYYNAPKSTSAVNMVILAAVAPLMMLFIARVLLQEAITRARLLGSILALFGVAVLVTRGHPSQLAHLHLNPGDFWTLAGALCFSTYSVTLRFFKGQLPASVFLFFIFLFGLLWSAPLYIWELRNAFVNPFVPGMRGSMLYIGLIASCFAFLCWNGAVARIGAVRSGIIYYLLPVFGSFEAVLLLGESVSATQFAGGAMVLGGVVFSSLPAPEALRYLRAVRQAKKQ